VFIIDASARRSWGFASGLDFIAGLFNQPTISPDGLRIAYSYSTSLAWRIFVMPTDGGLPAQASGGPDGETWPTWTPGSDLLWWDGSGPHRDSRESVSVTGARVVAAWGTNPGLYLKAGSGYLPFVAAGPDARLEAPAFSPNGSALAWIKVRYGSSGRTGMDIIVAEADGRHPQTIASLPLGDFISDLSLAWSPDGRRLAFSYPETLTSAHVFVVDHDGARLTQITSNPVAMDRSVSWSYLPRP
jgi:Tol biopolymer transport system component